jgi:7,8-dihydro-6-hydroxymethylpterin-pyrophosphokinase
VKKLKNQVKFYFPRELKTYIFLILSAITTILFIKELNIPRDDILKYDFVLQPFMELCYANFNKYN